MKSIDIEIADNSDSLSRGMMYRKHLDRDKGMLFKFPSVIFASFWGKNTYIPLDLAFISTAGEICDVKEIVPMSTKTVHSSFPCKYALEVNAGFLKENGIAPGDKVTIDENEKKISFGRKE